MCLVLDHSLHDAWIEFAKIGPRREIRLTHALGSPRLSDPRERYAGTFRLGAIANFEEVHVFSARFEPDPIARIECFSVLKQTGPSCTISLEIDP